MNSPQRVRNIIDAMKGIRVLVVGDIILDVYEHCVVKRISPEAPVPVALVIKTSSFLGGAGNVANNVQSLGAQVSLIGVVGDDSDGNLIQDLLEEAGIQHQGVIVDQRRVTTTKKRVVSGTQQLIRIDREVTDTVNEKMSDAIIQVLREQILEHDIVIVSDYSKGLLTEDVIDCIKDEARGGTKKIFVDSKSRHLLRYAGVDVIKLNRDEAEALAQEVFDSGYTNLENIGKKISHMLHSNLVITLGGDGMALFEGDTFLHKKTNAREVFDVSGAGDTVLATIASVVGAGASLREAVDLSNYAAGYVVSKLGTTVCDGGTLKDIAHD